MRSLIEARQDGVAFPVDALEQLRGTVRELHETVLGVATERGKRR